MNQMKRIGKQILGKLPLFLLCVFFISGYNYLFGKENVLVGVTLLMGLLIFMQGSFGIRPIECAQMIPLLFVGMGVGAKLSLLNPVLGLFINVTVYFFCLKFTHNDETNGLQLPFLMGYIMLQGNDVSGHLFTLRLVSLAVVGVLIGLVYYAMHRKDTDEGSHYGLVLKVFDIHNRKTQWGIALTVTLTLTTLLCMLLGIPKFMWINLTILSILSPIEGEFGKRKYRRLPATVLGCLLFFVLFELLLPQESHMAATLLFGFLSMFISSYFIKTTYNSFSALATGTFLLPARDMILVRLGTNVAGLVVALAAAFAFGVVFKAIRTRREAEPILE